MELEEIQVGTVVVFAISGNIMSCDDSMEIYNRIKACLNDGYKNFILDMADVPWINSQGVGMLACSLSAVRNSEGTLTLAAISDKVRRVLEITRFSTLLSIYENRKQALMALE